MRYNLPNTYNLSDFLWDSWCTLSIVGIWPRYIEPMILRKTTLTLEVPGLKRDLRAAFFSDLHMNPRVKDRFLNKIVNGIQSFNPDLIFFTGDFLCDGELSDEKRLVSFLERFHAPYGAYAVLGNHDYSEPVSINDQGDYDVSRSHTPFKKAFQRLFYNLKLSGKITDKAQKISEHDALKALLAKSPFKLLNNSSHQIRGEDFTLNVTGLGEYMMGRSVPKKAFESVDKDLPGIILTHNPDAIPSLSSYPGSVVLSGHIHGGQVNLPWVWKKLTLMEHIRFKEGLVKEGSKSAYITRGVGSVKPFRWNASPEIVHIYLKGV